MQHLRIRCKHCQREYTYCTYGNGPEYGTESGCSMEYCADCQKAIDEALGKIPKKYTWRWLDICPTLGLLEALAETKEQTETLILKTTDLERQIDDRLLTAFARAGDRTAAMSALCRHLQEQAPIIPICFKSTSVLTQTGVLENLVSTAAEPFYGLEDCTVYMQKK